MKTRGLTLVEGILSLLAILLLGGLAIFASAVVGRQSRDTARLADVRQVQAALERSRNATGSYPASLDGLDGLPTSLAGMAYAAVPQGCASDADVTCRAYTLNFSLEGRLGGLSGGSCQATPDGIACAKPK